MMVSFHVTFSALALLLTAGLSSASFEFIAGYEPGSQVTDHNAIDLDQAAMEAQLILGTAQGFENALKIYAEGGHSKVVAEVTLTAPLVNDVSKGTSMVGVTTSGVHVVGKATDNYPSGSITMSFQYNTSNDQDRYNLCQVGSLVYPNTDGCLAPSGTLTIEGEADIGYTYDVRKDNVAKRSIAGFSTSAQSKMYECEKCPYKMYQKYFDYYGTYDFANQIILAAFAGSRTNFRNFNNDYGIYGYEGRDQIIKKTSAYMVIWMYAIREMEDALDDCKEACTIRSCNDDPVHAWDEAVAFYTGSLEGEDGSGKGILTYALADKRCANFKTCGINADAATGTAYSNHEIFRQFAIGKSKITQGQCASARGQKEAIETLMTVPLIQGILRYTWKAANEPYSEIYEAEQLAFALAVLPLVSACDKLAAKTIAENVGVGKRGTVNFAVVKEAIESTYECMGVAPEMIGGLWDPAFQSYVEGAEPMNYSGAFSTSTLFTVVATGIASLSLFF